VDHSFTIPGLLPLNTYYFKVVSVWQGTAFTSNGSFTTLQMPIFAVRVNSGLTNATISWRTYYDTDAQIQYGLTPAFGLTTPLDPTPTTTHSMTLTGLQEAATYYFRILSSASPNQWNYDGTFSTFYANVVSPTNSWNYSTNNWDGVNWKDIGFPDNDWPFGPALLWADRRPAPPPSVQPTNTHMPISTATMYPYPAYYFRTYFTNTGPVDGYAMVFSNFVDDGAVFYLNGTEIYRLRMPAKPAVITNGTWASSLPVGEDATVPDVFRLAGDWMTNLVVGQNLLAVEVHNYTNNSMDIVFGSSMGLVQASASETKLRVTVIDNVATVSWDGKACTLQHAFDLNSANSWSDVPGPIRTSPYSVTNPTATTFYRLRN
jgi:hypothetical protein